MASMGPSKTTNLRSSVVSELAVRMMVLPGRSGGGTEIMHTKGGSGRQRGDGGEGEGWVREREEERKKGSQMAIYEGEDGRDKEVGCGQRGGELRMTQR